MFNSKMFNQGPFNGVPGQRPVDPAVQLLEMLYLFNAEETLVAVLPQDTFFDTRHREVLNGENTFTFSFPADHADAQYIQEGNIVGYKDLDVSWHLFEIRRIIDLHGDGLTRTAFCEHIFYELIDDIVTDKRPTGSATSALAAALENTRWQVGIVDDLGASSTNFYYESALAAVQKVATAWKGELRWRCIMSGGTITRYVDLLAARGQDTGKQFAYTKDIIEIEREVDTTSIITAAYGRGKGVETESGEGYGRRLTFEDEVWTTAGGDPADKPADQEWVGDPAALAQWGRPGGRHRFGIYTNEDQTDAAALLQETWDYVQEQKDPRTTYRMKVTLLETLSGYSHEAVRMGDMVRVIDRKFNPELLISARVVDLDRDLKNHKNTEVVLGSFAPSIVDVTIDTQKKVKELANKPYNTAWLDGKISVLQNQIENTAAYVFQTEGDGILIMDAATSAAATKAMKLGGGIFAIANSKTAGAWNWRTFGDGSGFTADEITTGTLYAALVNIIAADGKVVLDDDGLKVYDASDNLRVHLGEYATGKFGIKMVDGEIYSSLIQTTESTSGSYIKLGPPAILELYGTSGTLAMKILAGGTEGRIRLFDGGTEHGQLYATYSLASVNHVALVGSIPVALIGPDGTYLNVVSGQVNINGDLDVIGDITKTGSVSYKEPTLNYGNRLLYIVETPELKYYDSGVTYLKNGEAIVQFDPIFLECIESDTDLTPWQIWTDCYGENDVYVTEVGTNYFKVKERNGGMSSNKVIWRFEATRKNYAGIRLMEVVK